MCLGIADHVKFNTVPARVMLPLRARTFPFRAESWPEPAPAPPYSVNSPCDGLTLATGVLSTLEQAISPSKVQYVTGSVHFYNAAPAYLPAPRIAKTSRSHISGRPPR